MFAIDLDKVCHVVLGARAFDAKADTIDEGEDASNPIDDEMGGMLSTGGGDASYDELVAFINELNVDEQVELVALAWVGRGSFGREEWGEAVAEARREHNRRTGEYLLGMPLLSDYLEEGLATFDHSCGE